MYFWPCSYQIEEQWVIFVVGGLELWRLDREAFVCGVTPSWEVLPLHSGGVDRCLLAGARNFITCVWVHWMRPFPTFAAGSQQMGAGWQEYSKFYPLSYLLLTTREHLRGSCCLLYCTVCIKSYLLCIGHTNKPTQRAAVTHSSLPLTLFWERNGLVALLGTKQTTIDLIGLSTSLPLSPSYIYKH